MITYQEENLKDFLPEFDKLLRVHMDEININRRYGFEFKPNYAQYVKMQEIGIFFVLTCRRDKELIGYIVFSIYPNIRFQSCLVAKEDLYYIKPEDRRGRNGYKLFTESEKLLKQRGVNQIILSTKVYQDHSKLFEHFGYEFYEKHFSKKI
jgi:hypothetical protein